MMPEQPIGAPDFVYQIIREHDNLIWSPRGWGTKGKVYSRPGDAKNAIKFHGLEGCRIIEYDVGFGYYYEEAE